MANGKSELDSIIDDLGIAARLTCRRIAIGTLFGCAALGILFSTRACNSGAVPFPTTGPAIAEPLSEGMPANNTSLISLPGGPR